MSQIADILSAKYLGEGRIIMYLKLKIPVVACMSILLYCSMHAIYIYLLLNNAKKYNSYFSHNLSYEPYYNLIKTFIDLTVANLIVYRMVRTNLMTEAPFIKHLLHPEFHIA
jgi:hypothetical protein